MKSSDHAGRRLRQRCDALLASAGVGIGVLLCAVSAGSVGWVWWRQELAAHGAASAESARVSRQIRAGAEAALASGDLALLRRSVAAAATSARAGAWTLTLGDGRTLASSDESTVVVETLPETWPTPASAAAVMAGDSVEQIVVPGRGTAILSVRTAVNPVAAWSDPTLVGLAGGCVVIVGAWFFACRGASRRLVGMVRVYDALASESAGETALEALKVDESFGPEAATWNLIIAERDAARKKDLEVRVQRVLNASSPGEGAGALAGLCDAMWMGLIIIDADGRISYCNGAAATLLHGKREDFPGRPVSECITEPELVSQITRAIAGGCRHRVMHEKHVDGQGTGQSTLRFSIKSLRKDDHGVAFVVIEDITQQKVAEESRHSFAAQVTHELRTPLTNMRLYVDTLLEDETHDPQVRAKCLNVVSSEIRRLERVVSDMLSVSEMEAGSIMLRRDDVRMDALLEEIEADHRPAAQDKEITLHFDLPPKLPVLDGDRDKISMALHNLLGNAIKYTPAGGEVRVIVTEENGQLTIMVKDNGIGIKPEECELVFEKFYRAKDKRLSGITGSGLGLAIARQVVRLHGGDITVSSQIDRGSTFTLTLPLTGHTSAPAVRAAA